MSVAYKMPASKLGQFEKALAKDLRKSARDAAFFAAKKTIPIVRDRTLRAPPASDGGSVGAVATKTYIGAWHAERVPEGAVLSNSSPYAAIIELGRLPGRRPPPTRVIEKWLRIKGASESDARGRAFIIARAIGRRGLRARFVMTGALQQMENFLTIEMERMFARAAENAAK